MRVGGEFVYLCDSAALQLWQTLVDLVITPAPWGWGWGRRRDIWWPAFQTWPLFPQFV